MYGKVTDKETTALEKEVLTVPEKRGHATP